MLAGSIAGMSEHAFMFPADTVKTRMQVSAQRQQPQYASVFSAFNTILKSEGLAGLYRCTSAKKPIPQESPLHQPMSPTLHSSPKDNMRAFTISDLFHNAA